MVVSLHATAGEVRLGFDLWVEKIPWRRAWQLPDTGILQYSCLEVPMDRGASRLQSMGSQRVRND